MRLSEVLARMRHDSVLSGAYDGALRNSARIGVMWLQRLRGALPTRADGYAGIAMAFAMMVVVVNALIMQRERHPAPFFLESAPSSAASANAPSEHSGPSTTSEIPAPPRGLPPIRPSESSSHPEPNSNSRPVDPIAEMLRSAANKDTQRLLATAQTALIKLGYSIRNGTGSGPDTIAALRDFEKAHGLSISSEVTPRIVKLLAAAVNSSVTR
jgi:hypothetical protein